MLNSKKNSKLKARASTLSTTECEFSVQTPQNLEISICSFYLTCHWDA